MTAENLDAWAREMCALLAEMMEQEFQYELGENELLPAAAGIPDGVPEPLQPLYRLFDRLSMPDVHSGYFIEPAARIVTGAALGEPTRISGAPPHRIFVFGYDGGGGRFALSTDDGTVFYLPDGGAVEDGVFIEDHLVRARRMAGDVTEFLEILLRDLRAFVTGKQPHRYITDWVPPVDRAN